MSGLDRIIASVPATSTAGRVTARGEHWEPTVKAPQRHSDVPLPVTQPQGPEARALARRLVGQRVGRLTVMGYAADRGSKSQKARWVVRCDCGAYEHRKLRAIVNPRNGDDACTHCLALVQIKKRYATKGSRPVEEFAGRRVLEHPAGQVTTEAEASTDHDAHEDRSVEWLVPADRSTELRQ